MGAVTGPALGNQKRTVEHKNERWPANLELYFQAELYFQPGRMYVPGIAE